MALESPAGVVNSPSTDAKIQRHTTQAILGGPVGSFAGGVSARAGGAHGVVGHGDLFVTQSVSPGMSVLVAPGIAAVTGTVSAEQGVYSVYNDAAVTKTISPAHASLTRWDLVIARPTDPVYSGTPGDYTPVIDVVAGTPSGSPSYPSLAAYPNALVLARVVVAGGATSILNASITDLRTFAAAIGGKARCLSTGRPAGSSLYSGLEIYELDTGKEFVWNGTAWRGQRVVEFGPGGPASGTTSGTVEALTCQLGVPDQGCAGVLKVWGHLMMDAGTSADVFQIMVKDSATTLGADRVGMAGARVTGNPIGRVAMVAGAGKTINLYAQRIAGSGTGTFAFDSAYNSIHALFVPSL